MSYAGYGGRQNQYDQRGAPSPGGGYTSPGYAAPSMGHDDYGGQNVEMAPLAQNGAPTAQSTAGFFDMINTIDDAMKDIEQKNLPAVKSFQQAALNSTDPAAATANIQRESERIMQQYRDLVNQVRILKSDPANQQQGARGAQMKRVDTKLKQAIRNYTEIDRDFQHKLRDQIARQYRIVRPDASEDEVQAAVDNPNNQQMFSQALMQSDRQGQSRSALNAVQSRHEEIQKIERQIIELAELFQDMDVLIVQQEAAVTNIEMKGEEVVENMDKGTQEIGVAIRSAKNARKWKWWCLGICVLIIAIIIIVVLIYHFVIAPGQTTVVNKPTKRFQLPVFRPVLARQPWNPTERAAEVLSGARKMRRFQA